MFVHARQYPRSTMVCLLTYILISRYNYFQRCHKKNKLKHLPDTKQFLCNQNTSVVLVISVYYEIIKWSK